MAGQVTMTVTVPFPLGQYAAAAAAGRGGASGVLGVSVGERLVTVLLTVVVPEAGRDAARCDERPGPGRPTLFFRAAPGHGRSTGCVLPTAAADAAGAPQPGRREGDSGRHRPEGGGCLVGISVKELGDAIIGAK